MKTEKPEKREGGDRSRVTPKEVPKSAGRVARPSDEIEEEEMPEAQADGRVHAQSHTPTIAPGKRD